MTEWNRLSAFDIAKAIRCGDTRPSDVMRAHLDRIAAREDEIGAFVHLDPDAAMARAVEADERLVSGPLFGVPFAVKDIIDTDFLPTEWGSDIYQGRQPDTNAACIRAFLDAGAIPIGKTVTTEFAYFKPGKTANPHNPGHTPGGSSSGSAAAVADFMAPLAFGSQTAASLVRPAAYCGTAAFKPTTGGFDLDGVMGLSPSLDTLGVLARDPVDLSLARAALLATGFRPPMLFTEVLPRIALMRGPHWQDGSLEMRDVCTRALQRLADTGAETGEIAHPPVCEDLTAAHVTVMGNEVARVRSAEYETHKDRISPQFAALIEAGRALSEAGYGHALGLRDRANAWFERIFSEVDAILAPSAPGPAPPGLEATGDPLYSRMWTLLQLPCVALPFGTDAAGLPLGIQLIGPKGGDEKLLDIANWVHNALKS